MEKLIKKSLEKLNITIALFLAVLMTVGFGGVNYVLAANTSTQEASTAAATTISVVGKVADTAVTTITFPQGAPSATISNPYNDVDTVTDAQVLSGTVSEPVVRLKNTSGGALNITLEITSWTNGIAASEGYALSDPATTTTTTITDTNLSADGNSATVATGASVASTAYKALYLEMILSALAGVSGTSTLTVLGES
ncbi:MAG: hypothetical protein WDK96_02790 [Candidatus Paceibacterota bacterium]|jgi:hypothetical protein